MWDWIDDFDWFDMGVLGGLSEELANDERKRKRIEDEWNQDQEDESDY